MSHTQASVGNNPWWRPSAMMLYATILLAVSIPLSEFGMSISQFLLLGFWTVEGADFSKNHQSSGISIFGRLKTILAGLGNNLAGKFRMLFNNRAAMVVVSLYVLHIIGTLYSADLQYALKDLRIKLPLLSLPVILATSSLLSKRKFNIVLIFFVLAVFAGTVASMIVLFTRHISDPRELSIFISHIRFGLTICFAIFILFYFLFSQQPIHKGLRVLMGAGILWFLSFLLILESVTGIIITLLLGFIFMINFALKIKKLPIKLTILSLGFVIAFVSILLLKSFITNFNQPKPVDIEKLDKYTHFGTPYQHDTCSYDIENGEYVGLFLCNTEMRNEWNKRSEMRYDGLDKKGQELKHTLIRFLHSKGLRKDAIGVRQLSNDEIRNIENGVANADYLKSFNLKSRFEQMAMGYHNYITYGDPNASSLMQRVEYWKTSAYIIKQHWLAGVGTGDIKQSFQQAYVETHTKLQDEFRNRSHNQFLAIFISFGVFGLLWFLFTLVYPALKLGRFHDYFYIVFFVIIVMSMITEDTLETQACATYFAFFNALLLFGRKRDTSAAEHLETHSSTTKDL